MVVEINSNIESVFFNENGYDSCIYSKLADPEDEEEDDHTNEDDDSDETNDYDDDSFDDYSSDNLTGEMEIL